jgi:hypothetical protein
MFIDIIGWIGSIIIVMAYGLNSYQKIRADSFLYYTLNITGGILLVIYSFYKTAYANVFINVVWILIAVTALFKVGKHLRS